VFVQFQKPRDTFIIREKEFEETKQKSKKHPPIPSPPLPSPSLLRQVDDRLDVHGRQLGRQVPEDMGQGHPAHGGSRAARAAHDARAAAGCEEKEGVWGWFFVGLLSA
jgi:hypothetical protein